MTPEEMLASERQNVGSGWQPLIDELDAKLRDLDPDYVVEQIKEKFGGLRYYIAYSDDMEMYGKQTALINAAEAKSLTICEDCASTVNVATQAHPGRSWIRTLCGGCR